MKSYTEMVSQFHSLFDVPIRETPGFRRRELRRQLITEEYCELMNAIESCDLVETADGIADLIYVLCGAALEFGIPLDAVFTAVHESNMKKIGGPIRRDGKILKPDGWEPPDILAILESRGY